MQKPNYRAQRKAAAIPATVRRKLFPRSRIRYATTAVACATVVIVAAAPVPAHADTVAFYMPGTSPTPAVSETVGVAAIGAAVQGLMTTANQIGYPASIGPFIGSMALDYSVDQGVSNLAAAIATVPATSSLMLFGVSQGDLVLTDEELAMMAAGHPNNVTFVRIADPSGPTGLLGRNVGLLLPGITCIAAPQDSPYNTINYVHQYDVFADWPADQLNLLADMNAIAGGVLFHNYAAYNIDVSTLPANDVTTTVNSLGATTTTYFIPATGLLPLLQLAKDAGASDQVVNQLQPALKPIIDAAYIPLPPLVQIPQRIFQSVVNAAVAAGIWTVKALRDTSLTAAAAFNNISVMLSSAGTQLQQLTSAAAQKPDKPGITSPAATPTAATSSTAADPATTKAPNKTALKSAPASIAAGSSTAGTHTTTPANKPATGTSSATSTDTIGARNAAKPHVVRVISTSGTTHDDTATVGDRSRTMPAGIR